MRERLRRLGDRIGFRGSILLFLALWSGGNAWRLVWTDPEVLGTGAYLYLGSLAPLWVLAIPWAVVCVLCLVQSVMAEDWLAFGALAGLLVLWAVIYLAGGIQGVIPQGAWSCIIQIVVAGLIVRISRWPEPPRGG